MRTCIIVFAPARHNDVEINRGRTAMNASPCRFILYVDGTLAARPTDTLEQAQSLALEYIERKAALRIERFSFNGDPRKPVPMSKWEYHYDVDAWSAGLAP